MMKEQPCAPSPGSKLVHANLKRWSHLAEIAGKRDVSELFRLVKVAPGVLQVLAKVVPAQGKLA